MTPPLVDPSDLAIYMDVDLEEVNWERAQMLLADAQALCEAIVSPLPAAAAVVIKRSAARAYNNPFGVTQETAGPFAQSMPPAGVYLTSTDRRALRSMVGQSSAFTIDPTPAGAGTGLAPWDTNVTWPDGVPLVEDVP